MIQAKELRVGNLLHSRDKDGDGSIVVVESIFKEGINSFVSQGGYDYEYRFETTDRYDWSWVEPIPISPEILEKAGFVITRAGNYTMMDEDCWLNENKEGGYDYLMLYSSEPVWMTVANISYLHQLQNLYFSLTGQELKIDL